MSKHNREVINKILKDFNDIDYVRPEMLPNIDLYMDQVLTFLDDELESTKRTDEEKTLTKTMINNYTKNKVLPPPEKKKYSRDHMLAIIMVYYMKNFLSMKDIAAILNPITDKYFSTDSDLSLFDIYSELVNTVENKMAKNLIKDVITKYNMASRTFQDAPEDDQEYLQTFALICMLCFDVYVKKMMIEQLIDYNNTDK